MKKAAAANSKDDFRYVFEKVFEGLVIDRMEGNEEIFGKLMGDSEFRKLAVEHLLHKVYGALKKTLADQSSPNYDTKHANTAMHEKHTTSPAT